MHFIFSLHFICVHCTRKTLRSFLSVARFFKMKYINYSFVYLVSFVLLQHLTSMEWSTLRMKVKLTICLGVCVLWVCMTNYAKWKILALKSRASIRYHTSSYSVPFILDDSFQYLFSRWKANGARPDIDIEKCVDLVDSPPSLVERNARCLRKQLHDTQYITAWLRIRIFLPTMRAICAKKSKPAKH